MSFELKTFSIKIVGLILAVPLMGYVIMTAAESFENLGKQIKGKRNG